MRTLIPSCLRVWNSVCLFFLGPSSTHIPHSIPLLKFSEIEASDSTSNNCLFGIRNELKMELPLTRAYSSLIFQMKTLSLEGIWITNDLVGFSILGLSRQNVTLVDFIMANQVINCLCWVFTGMCVWVWLLWGNYCVCLVWCVVLKPPCASELPPGLLKRQTAEPHPQVFWFNRSGMWPKKLPF